MQVKKPKHSQGPRYMTINYTSHAMPEFGTGRSGREDPSHSHALGNVEHNVQAEAHHDASGDGSVAPELQRTLHQADAIAKKRFSKDPEIQVRGGFN